MINTIRGEIPDGWEINTMQKVIKFSNGKKKPIEIGNIPVYGGNGVLGYTDKSNSENVIVVGRVGAYCGSVYLEPNKCWVSDNAISGTSLLDDVYYPYQLLKTFNLNSMHIGSSQPLLTQGILNNIEIVLPPINIVKKYNNLIGKVYKKIFNTKIENKTLSNIRNTLLPKLINGEIDLSKISLEE